MLRHVRRLVVGRRMPVACTTSTFITQRGLCSAREIDWQSCGPRPVPYSAALRWQRRLQESVRTGGALDSCIALEHCQVYTLGRAATEDNVKFKPGDGIELLRVERGGEVTYHGPGQLVVYFIFDLNRHKRDLHWFVHTIEQVIIDTIARYGIEGRRDDGYPGVWVGDEKIAAVGISVSRWTTMHGVAINVAPELSDFEVIIPCGIEDRTVTSMHKVLAERGAAAPTIVDVESAVMEEVCDKFGVQASVTHPTIPL